MRLVLRWHIQIMGSISATAEVLGPPAPPRAALYRESGFVPWPGAPTTAVQHSGSDQAKCGHAGRLVGPSMLTLTASHSKDPLRTFGQAPSCWRQSHNCVQNCFDLLRHMRLADDYDGLTAGDTDAPAALGAPLAATLKNSGQKR